MVNLAIENSGARNGIMPQATLSDIGKNFNLTTYMRNFQQGILLCGLGLMAATLNAHGAKLTGTPIGTERGWNYEKNQVELNIAYRLFDGNLDTYFATEQRSFTWAGLDLGTPHVITRVGWAPRNDRYHGEERVRLAVIEGANSPDFMDAVPIYIIKERGTIGQISYGDVDCSRGFRYVRYVSTSDARCNLAELEFYGEEGEGDDSHMFQLTNLPTVCINTVNAEIPYDKEHEITSNIIIIDNNKIDVDKPGGVRERGNGSRQFPKKPWRIKFDKKQQVLGSPAKAKKWTLINNYGDKTLMRNVIAFEVARRVGMDYVPFCRPVDVIMNGEYKGCYQLCDQVEVNPGRVEITEMAPEDISGDALTGGYFIEVDAYASQEISWFNSSRGTPVTIKSPKDDEIVQAQSKYIENYFNRLESLVYSSDYNTASPLYLSMLDIKSFLQYFIVCELTGNTDSFWSTYMRKDRNSDKFVTGPVWDVDLGFHNDNRTNDLFRLDGGICATDYTFLSFTDRVSVAGNMKDMVRRIIQDNKTNRKTLSELWSIARNDNGLTAESLNEFVDETAAMLDQSQKLNFLRWPILNQMVHQNFQALGSYDAEVEHVKKYISARMKQLDKASLMNYDPDFTAIDEIEASVPVDVTVSGGVISFDGTTPFRVYSTDGVEVHAGVGPTRVLSPGMYIVTAAGLAARKVCVK